MKEGVHHWLADKVSGFAMACVAARVHNASLKAPLTDIATQCLVDRQVGCPQRIPHRYTPLWGTGLQPLGASNHRGLVVGFPLNSQLLLSSLTLCLADRPVGDSQQILQHCTPIWGTCLHPQMSCLSVWSELPQLPSFHIHFVHFPLTPIHFMCMMKMKTIALIQPIYQSGYFQLNGSTIQ